MAQLYPKWTNNLPKIVLASLVGGLGLLIFVITYWGSPEFLEAGYQPQQPVNYSHKFHVGELGMDCRYCHTKVEHSAVAGVPPTQTCMNCHKLVMKDSLQLAVVQVSWDNKRPIPWTRIHKAPDYVYFDHSIHVNNGIGCSSCHGDITDMEKVFQAKSLSMGWCLDCHKNPEKFIRPQRFITDTKWTAPDDQIAYGFQRVREDDINPPIVCTGCHR